MPQENDTDSESEDDGRIWGVTDLSWLLDAVEQAEPAGDTQQAGAAMEENDAGRGAGGSGEKDAAGPPRAIQRSKDISGDADLAENIDGSVVLFGD